MLFKVKEKKKSEVKNEKKKMFKILSFLPSMVKKKKTNIYYK
jgi:hypothetical protein